MSKDRGAKVVIIGGGIIGLFCAYYLNKLGKHVAIIDKGSTKNAASHGNCGLITPSHFQPLNTWSMVLSAVDSIGKEQAPFHMKLQPSRKFLTWGMKFLKNCIPSAVEKNAKSIQELLISSRKLYDDFFSDENVNCNWNEGGIYFLFKSKKAFNHFSMENEFTSRFGQNATRIPKNELLENEPTIRDDVAGAWIYQDDAWLRPDDLMKELRTLLKNRGVEIITDKVDRFEKLNGKIQSVITENGNEIVSEQFILAAGAWSPLIAKKLGVNLPIIPGKGYSITMESPKKIPTKPIIMMERMVVATPWENGYRLGSTMELAGYDDYLNEVRLNALRTGAKEYLRTPTNSNNEESWTGWRPMTPNSVPIIGPSRKINNLIFATGHGMLGMSMAPATGKLVAQIITNSNNRVSN